MFERILVAVDGSAHAEHALDRAAELARRFGAKVRLVFVMTGAPVPAGLRHLIEIEYETPASGVGLAPVPEGRFPASIDPSRRDEHEEERRVGLALLDRAKAHLAAAGVEAEPLLEAGDPAEAILRTAEAGSADLIVLGSRGLGPLKGLLLGSVSAKVSQLAPNSCLLVK